MQKRLLNVAELAEYIGLSTATIYNWSSARRIPAACIVRLGGALRFDLIQIDKWLEAQQGRA
jgi:excisionase family DNA binding protein